jgi:hypothetical protein
MLKDDPVIKEVREARSSISEKLGHDPKKIVEYYIKLQKKHQERLAVSRQRRGKSAANCPSV